MYLRRNDCEKLNYLNNMKIGTQYSKIITINLIFMSDLLASF